MSGFKPYPAYKDSGVAWIGEVPEGWPVYSLKRTVDGCVNGLWGDEPDGVNDIAVIRVADFERSFLTVSLGKLTYRSITAKEKLSRLIKSGDLLIEKSGGGEKTLVGCVVLFNHEFEAITSNFVARMRPLAEFDSQFLCYAFSCLYQGRVNYPSVKQVTGIQNLDAESYLQEQFCFPARSEQAQIARFLDHETARIDALIEEQQRLIELLKEKRQTVISHAVTKGLDPTVPMKDSGVEWLGEVPAHWSVSNIEHCLDGIGDVDHYMPQSVEKGIPYVMTGDLRELASNINFEECKQVGYDDYLKLSGKIKCSKGDVIMARYATIGSVSYIDVDAKFLVSYSCVTIKPNVSKVSGLYLFYYFKSDAFLRGIQRQTNTNTQGNVGISDIKKLKVVLPAPSEQLRIIECLQSELSKLDAISDLSQSTIALAKEKRSALISAAVTGKIDVRRWQSPGSEQAPLLEAEAV